MGCCISTPTANDQISVDIPDVKWEKDPLWPGLMEVVLQSAIESGVLREFRENFKQVMFKVGRDWANAAYPECSQAGSIEDMGEFKFPVSYGRCKYPAKALLILDDNFTGVIHAIAVIVAPPLEETGENSVWTTPGAAVNTEEMKGAQTAALTLLAVMRQQNINAEHATVHIIMGADKLCCNFNITKTEPTVTLIGDEPTDEAREANKQIYQEAKTNPDVARGKFLPALFMNDMKRRVASYPGSTIWDEGPLYFSVNGTPYPHPVRLLAVRQLSKADDVDATIFKVTTPASEPSEKRVVLLRSPRPDKILGDIVCLSAVVAIDPEVLWPNLGDYIKSPAFEAAERVFLNRVRDLQRAGKFRSCKAYITMGSDQKMYKVVGNEVLKSLDQAGETTEVAGHVQPAGEEIPLETEKHDTGLEGFSITLTEEAKHNQWQSESHFQAMKHQMLERAQQNPGRFEAIAPQAALMSAIHVLKLNFPECEISDEDEFTGLLEESKIANTNFVVAKDPKQEPKSIVAVVYIVSRPRADVSWADTQKTTWLETDEMKAAEAALLAMMKKWYSEGKISDIDCMAQVMMGVDATIYQFVDGEKFIDYSDERMASFQWH
jgi:hypothetical protein